MTVRQVYYQLVSGQVIENSVSAYKAVSNALVDARQEGLIPWSWIEDRLRQPRGGRGGWESPESFLENLKESWRYYSRDIWATQSQRLELWLEKDALSGVFGDAMADYHLTLNVGRGYDGWSSIHNAAERFGTGVDVTVLYFGDFDPSGEDMVRSLRDRLSELGSCPEIIKVALTRDDIATYNLPPNPTKTTDSRAASHIARFGDVSSVELDALPMSVLRDRITKEIEQRLDLDALARVRTLEQMEREIIADALRQLG
jgi:hypothetical protein